MSDPLSCFKASDIRGTFPDPLSSHLAFALGMALASREKPRHVVIGHDVRLSCYTLEAALCAAFASKGIATTCLGLVGTEEIYFAAAFANFDLGIMITASHNPADENGFKLVRRDARPISNDSGLLAIKEAVRIVLATKTLSPPPHHAPPSTNSSYSQAYVDWLLTEAKLPAKNAQPSMKVLASVGNGAAGGVLSRLSPHLPFELILHEARPDGHFPNGVPNPLLPERRENTRNALLATHADFAVAFDGDFDRCFFYDGFGNFIESYYIVGLLAQTLLSMHPKSTIIHDPRLYWNTQDLVRQYHGKAVLCKTGHAFIKERMRKEDALYGGEMSAHHYFRHFNYCDSGMLPFLLVAKLLLESGSSLNDLVSKRIQAFPCSGEINRKCANPQELLEELERIYKENAIFIDHTDGLDMHFPAWRFNVRASNTEPLLRINAESRHDLPLLQESTKALLQTIDTLCAEQF